MRGNLINGSVELTKDSLNNKNWHASNILVDFTQANEVYFSAYKRDSNGTAVIEELITSQSLHQATPKSLSNVKGLKVVNILPAGIIENFLIIIFSIKLS